MTDAPVPFLSPGWCALAAGVSVDAPELHPPVPDHRVCQVVTGGPDGDVRYLVTVNDGRVGRVELLAAKSNSDADVVLTTQFSDAVAVAKGEQNPAVLFMQGRMKTAGDPGLTLEYLRLVSHPTVLARSRQLAERTQFAA